MCFSHYSVQSHMKKKNQLILREIQTHEKTLDIGFPSLGCHRVIDKSKEDLWKAAESHSPGGYQVVFDANGVDTLQGSYDHLAAGGRLVVYGMCLIYGRLFHFLIRMEKAVKFVFSL